MKGKRNLFIIVACILIVGTLIGLFKGYESIWAFWNIPDLEPYFYDLRNLTAGADSLSLGYDPLYSNPQDPAGRTLNLPRLVQYILYGLKINEDDTALIGAIFIFLFFVGIYLSLKEIDNPTVIFLAFVIFSPSVVLGIERGNFDLFIFFLVGASIFLSNFPWLSMSILLFATFLKLFPVFALLFLLRNETRKLIIVFSVFSVSLLGYVLVFFGDWSQIFQSTQKGYGLLAYGVKTFARNDGGGIDLLGNKGFIPLAGLIIITLAFYTNSLYTSGYKLDDAKHLDAFRAGAGIYIGTFFLGNNWAYRLMFLIFVIPQLVSWRKDERRGLISLVALFSILVSTWSIWLNRFFPNRLVFAIDETSNWLLFASLFYLLLCSMPLYIQEGFRKVHSFLIFGVQKKGSQTQFSNVQYDRLPRISVIVPSYNQGEFIEETIVSVLGQNYPDLELIVIDGGSTDRTLEILKRYGDQIIWVSEPDDGQTEAINKGLKMATGEVVAFLNSDDIYLPESLDHVGQHFVNNPHSKVATGRCVIIDRGGNRTRRLIEAYKNFWLRFGGRNTLLVLNYISQPATFWKRSLIEEIGLLDENLEYTMDYDYWLRISEKYPIDRIYQKLAGFRVHDSSKTISSNEMQLAENYLVTKQNASGVILLLRKFHNSIIRRVYEILSRS